MVQRFVKLICALALVLLLSFTAVAIDEPLTAISGEEGMHLSQVAAAAVYNIENDTVIFSHNADAVLPTASFTKIMTAVCAYEVLSDRLDESITVTSEMLAGSNAAKHYGYKAGDTVSVRTLFAGMLMVGYNDCAHILACVAKGSIENFVAYMNEKALALGMKDTVYKNVTGLDAEGMVTSANDSIIIATEFYKNHFLKETAGLMSFEGTRFKNQNKLLLSESGLNPYYDSRIIGINTGMTFSAGWYVASAVEDEALSYIIVVLGGRSTEEESNPEYLLTSELADYAFDGYGYVDVIKTSGVVCEIPVNLSTDSDYVTLVPASSLTLYLPLSVDVTKDLVYSYRLNSDSLDAPITEGQVVGSYTVSQNGNILGSVDLVTKNSLSRSEFLVVLDSIENFTQSTFFVVTVISIVVLTVAYFIISAILRHRRRNRHYGRR